MDKTKILEQPGLLHMAEQDREMLNPVYREICERLGMDTALAVYDMFRGQQISFPVRLQDPARVQQRLLQEYDGTNVRDLVTRYGYSEKSIRRIIKAGR